MGHCPVCNGFYVIANAEVTGRPTLCVSIANRRQCNRVISRVPFNIQQLQLCDKKNLIIIVYILYIDRPEFRPLRLHVLFHLAINICISIHFGYKLRKPMSA